MVRIQKQTQFTVSDLAVQCSSILLLECRSLQYTVVRTSLHTFIEDKEELFLSCSI